MQSILRPIDDFLNGITMYRLVLYGLIVIVGAGIGLAFIGTISYSGPWLLTMALILVAVCYAINKLIAVAFDIPVNSESAIITALILTCILAPPADIRGVVLASVGGVVAMASKYILAIRHKHIFNPAVVGSVVLGLAGILSSFWWIATAAMLPFTVLVGLAVVRKIRRFRMVSMFIICALVMLLIIGVAHGRSLGAILADAFVSWPLVFAGTIMLTEPATQPPRPWQQLAYGAAVGLLFTSQTHIGPATSNPANVLLLGNLLAYAWRPKYRVRARLVRRTELGPGLYDLQFKTDRPVRFDPGQYMEWTLPHPHADSRGVRRTFSLSSAPTETDLHIGVRVPARPSSFKNALLALPEGAGLAADNVAGGFTLPGDATRKLAFVAGGIGITPFRSMVKHMIDTGTRRDIVLIYAVNSEDALVYADVFRRAAELGVRLVPVVGQLTEDSLGANVDDAADRSWYISGPPAMVDAVQAMLIRRGISRPRIKRDFFAGY